MNGRSCPCGCARAVKPGQKYAMPACTLRQIRTAPEYAALRTTRNTKAVAARRAQRRARALELAERFPTKAAAYAAGARAEYCRAHRWFRRQLARRDRRTAA